MSIKFDTLTIETEFENKLQVLNIELREELNEHAELRIIFRVEENKAEDIFKKCNSDTSIKIKEDEKCIFAGFLSDIKMDRRSGGVKFYTVWHGATKSLDVRKKERAVVGSDLTFEQLVSRVTAEYGEIFVDTISNGRLIPGFLLQYKETDWEFIRRLAGLAGGIITPDCSSQRGDFTFGLPNTTEHEIKEFDSDVVTEISFEEFGKDELFMPLTTFLQDYYHKYITTQEILRLGERVSFDGFSGVIESIHIKGDKGHVVKTYGIVSEYGLKVHSGINEKYSGLHLPATVKDVRETTICVDFDIETISTGNDMYFAYAVESSAWYAMPEVGSSVHIYLPERDETLAYAIHSLRNTEEGAANASATSDPSSKSYTHPSGSSMVLDGSALTLNSDASGNATATVGGDGTLGLKAKNIVITAQGNIHIGSGEEHTTPTVELETEKAMTIQAGALSGDGAMVYLGEQLYLKGDLIDYKAKIHDAVELPEEIANRNEGIQEQIDAVNASAKEMEKAKLQEAKKKTGMGLFAMAIGAVAIAAVCVCTCGAGLVVVGAVAGAVAITAGAAQVAEGVMDYKKAAESGDFSQSFNFMRDTIFCGNQALYDAVLYGSVLVCGAVIALATGGSSLKVMLEMGKDMASDVGMNLVMDFLDDGSINNGLDFYLKSMCMAGACSGLSMGIDNYVGFLKNAKGFSCNKASWARLGMDSAVDIFADWAQTGDFSLSEIFARNFLFDKVIGGDPIDMATGSLYIPAVDMVLPDVREDFKISRKYESINRRTGLLGYGWTTNIENCMHITPERCEVLMSDGHVETFILKDGQWVDDKGESKAVTLENVKEGFKLHDAREKRTYYFDAVNGKQTKIVDAYGNQSLFFYEDGVLTEITTFSGKSIKVEISGGRLRKLTDVLGRTVTYTYEDNFLISVNQNGRGITRYTYDKKGHVIDITDQNNKTYTVNTFDEKGRVVYQKYPDGTSCQIDYDDKAHTSTFFYPETGRKEKAYFNGRNLVTKIEYQDNTTVEYGYDQWLNRVYEKNRRGAVNRKLYSETGNLLQEQLPNGLVIDYRYDEKNNCIEKTDSAGACTKYVYDEYGNLMEESVLYDKVHQRFNTKKYSYTGNGLLLWEEDALGNRTTYLYKPDSVRPYASVSPEGYEFKYGYDAADRKTEVTTSKGTVSYRYNGLHYVSRTVDPLGNSQREEYDNLGNLIRKFSGRQSEASTDGTGYSYRYDYLDRLIWVRDPLGREKTYKRDGRGNILSETLLSAQGSTEIERTFDANDNIVRTVLPDDGIWSTRYDAEGNLIYEDTAGCSKSGRYYTYDSMNNITRITDDEGSIIHRYEYDLHGKLVWEADALGHDKHYEYDAAGRNTGLWEYVSEGKYRVTQYEYDGNGNVILEKKGLKEVEALKNSSKYLSIHKSYDKEGRLVLVEDETGAVVEYTYDILNNRTSETAILDKAGNKRIVNYIYDEAGRLVKKAKILDNNRTSVTSYEYDASDNLINITFPEGAKIGFVYDEAERVVCRYETDSRNSIKRAMVYRYSDFCAFSEEGIYGKQCTIKEFNQLLMDEPKEESSLINEALLDIIYRESPSEIRYYSGKRAQKVFSDLRNVYADINVYESDRFNLADLGEEKTDYYCRRFEYDFRGNVISKVDSLGEKWNYTYSAAGSLTSVKAPDGATESYEYDDKGRLFRHVNGAGEAEYELSYDSLNHIVSEKDALGHLIRYDYDALGRQTRVTGPDGKADRTAAYNIWGQPVRITDGNGQEVHYERDSWGRVSKVIYPDESAETYEYNYAGQIVKATDALGHVTEFNFDNSSRLSSIIRQDGYIRSFEYDLEGRRIRRTDENGCNIFTSYNLDGNPVLQKAVSGKSEITSVYTYDEEGSLTAASEGGNTYRYDYDTEGHLLTKTASSGMKLSNSYDSVGRLSSIDADGNKTAYEYDKAGRVSRVTDHNGMTVSYSYSAAGELEKASYSNGIVTDYSYDARGNITRLKTFNARTNTSYLESSFTYDGNGNRLSRTEQILSGGRNSIAYKYDALNRLVEENRNSYRQSHADRQSLGYSRNYEYDKVGNRTASIRRTNGCSIRENYSYNNRNQLVSVARMDADTQSMVSSTIYEYDKAGNLISEKNDRLSRVYAYDALNRCESISESGKEIQKNIYDAEGYRCGLKTEKEDTGFLYHYGMLLEEEQKDGKSTTYTLGNSYISLYNESVGADYYTITDEQDSVRLVVDEDGNPVARYDYDAFGCAIDDDDSAWHTNGSMNSINSRLRYNSQIYDENTEDYYLRFRYYRPQIGRFLQEDIIYEDGLNLYAYCGSNPVVYCDPSGFADCGNGQAEKSSKSGSNANPTFATEDKLISHFEKHGGEFKGMFNTADEYLQGAQDVMKNGYKVEYIYKGETRIGYVQFMGNNSKGNAKFAFVGTNNDGYITTFHTESGKTFWKMLNGENIPIINPK